MARKTSRKAPRKAAKPTLLAGGNPQIPKGEGDRPVQAYIAAMPGWKRGAGRRLDALIARTVPGVRKAVRWNSPFYGVKDQGWFLAFHVFTKYIKVTFFRGSSLRPLPPVGSKDPNARYVHIHEDEQVDDAQLASWIEQAAALPGWDLSSELPPLPQKKESRVPAPRTDSPSKMIDARIRELADWRGATLKKMRKLIHDADPEVVEEWKWQKATSPGTAVWSHDGGICTGETYKEVVKLTFFQGASLKDPTKLFNASLEGNTRRAIDIREDDKLDDAAFRKLIREAVTFNVAKRKK